MPLEELNQALALARSENTFGRIVLGIATDRGGPERG
jgi:hypothetical protein